ncbi:hypothetical protein F2Q69_00048143 [Brassica cretica]|uniref:Uncharacterized protein n=1 Tax=Brassica cretica TaxID=69181 RepID=A0A8S9PMS4_BRACR|nr:hypothetical protein F2Q69_00048143 [Brassica cretica]
MAVAHAKAMEANNEFAETLEKLFQDVPRSDELYEIKKAKIVSSSNKFADDLRRATYEAKKALADSYLDVLISLKEKWEKKKAAADCEARLKEVMANIDRLKEIMNNNLLASDELLRLRAKEISEDLPEEFFAKVPSEVNEPGEETKIVGNKFEDGEFDADE